MNRIQEYKIDVLTAIVRLQILKNSIATAPSPILSNYPDNTTMLVLDSRNNHC